MKVIIYDGIRLLTKKKGKPLIFRSKETARKYISKKGREKDIGSKIKLIASFEKGK